jgi:hypothetical protein
LKQHQEPISWCCRNPTCGTANPHGLSGFAPRQVDERWRHQESRSGCEGQEAKHRFMNCERRLRCAPRLGSGAKSSNWQEARSMMALIAIDCASGFPPPDTASSSGSRAQAAMSLLASNLAERGGSQHLKHGRWANLKPRPGCGRRLIVALELRFSSLTTLLPPSCILAALELSCMSLHWCFAAIRHHRAPALC